MNLVLLNSMNLYTSIFYTQTQHNTQYTTQHRIKPSIPVRPTSKANTFIQNKFNTYYYTPHTHQREMRKKNHSAHTHIFNNFQNGRQVIFQFRFDGTIQKNFLILKSNNIT